MGLESNANATAFDPQLHILRSASRALAGKERHESDVARFNLAQHIQAKEWEEALTWLEAYEVCVRSAEFPLPDSTAKSVERAIEIIRQGVKEASE